MRNALCVVHCVFVFRIYSNENCIGGVGDQNSGHARAFGAAGTRVAGGARAKRAFTEKEKRRISISNEMTIRLFVSHFDKRFESSKIAFFLKNIYGKLISDDTSI